MATTRIGRIRRRATFLALTRPQGRGRAGPIRASYTQATELPGSPCVAYAVGRSLGGAVVRNRLRRRLRAAAAELSDLAPGAYLVRPERAASDLSASELRRALERALRAACQDQRSPSRSRP